MKLIYKIYKYTVSCNILLGALHPCNNNHINKNKKISKPVLSIKEINEIDENIINALDNNLKVEILFYTDGYLHSFESNIKKIDINHQKICFKNKIKVPFSDLIGIELIV